MKKQTLIPYCIFLAIVLICWGWYVLPLSLTQLYAQNWPAALTMLFGSFVAGSSPEGSASVAYPVFTLLLKIQPDVARNFAFAIQSIGMTAASLLIIGLKIKIERNYILYVTLGGMFGLILGTYYVVPLVSPMMAKLFFVSLWLSFGIVLWLENQQSNRRVFDNIQNFTRKDIFYLLFFGFIGGVISSVFGTGINIFTYCLMTIFYRVSEKVATPSSVIIMTIETLLGFGLHAQIIKDFQEEAFNLWICCVPVVVFFAPLGAFVISKMQRQSIAKILYVILIVQFLGAMWVIKPSVSQLMICACSMGVGLLVFRFLSKNRAAD